MNGINLRADALILLLVVLVLVVLFIVGWVGHIRALMRHHGHLYVAWRWFSGGLPPWVTREADRRYRANYDPGSVHYHFKARLHRAGIRTGLTIGPLLLVLAYTTQSQPVWLLSILIGTGMAAEVVWRVKAMERVHAHRRHARTLHGVIAPHANRAIRGRAGSWIKFTDPKRQQVRLELPKNWNGTPVERERLVQAASETLGYHPESHADWQLEGDNNHVVITNRKAPPDRVELRDIASEIEKSGEDAVVLGLGRGDLPVKVSLAEDSPHFGLSIGAGGGKSQLARLVAAQVLHNGGIVLILDPKRISHAWAKNLPNVRYAASTEEIHSALVWLNYEIDRRTNVADVGHDVEGTVLVNVGSRLLVIAEELNEMNSRLRTYWLDNREPKDPKKSPAITAMESALFMGRQVKINIFAVAQMMTALAAGSGAARENMGVRILGRYTKNNWRMLVPEFDMPKSRSMKPGRIQVVTAQVAECQAAFVTGREAREFASNGVVTGFPRDLVSDPMPVVEVVPDDRSSPALSRLSITSEPTEEPKPRRKITLAEASNSKMIPLNRKALANAAFRDMDFPSHCGVRMNSQGRPKEYWADELMAWWEKKSGKI